MPSQTFTTAGAGTFTVPSRVESLTIEAWGAGGSGGSPLSSNAAGGGGGGYSRAVISVNPGQAVFFNIGAGGTPTVGAGNPGGDSWINPAANSPPVSNGVIGGGGTANDSPTGAPGGSGSVGTVNFTGGTSGHGTAGVGGGGGGGAGSAGNGAVGLNGAAGGGGGAGGSPDGGGGGQGVSNGPAGDGTQPGGGGGGANSTGLGGNGANGQVRFSWVDLLITNLTNVPAKAFTRKHYFNELEKIRGEFLTNQEILKGLDEKGRADRDYQLAQEIADSFDSLTPTNYAKAMDAKDGLEKARKARDHHYFMDVVRRAWADHEAKTKK